jgi:hypothetical protein
LRLVVAAALLAASALAGAQSSARDTATWVVERLAAGEIESVANRSNAPERRREVLEAYRSQVGEQAFRDVYAQYRAGTIVEEIALGAHRLVIWKLKDHLAGQYFVEVDGRFLLDDVPGETRSRLRRALQEYRARASGRTD